MVILALLAMGMAAVSMAADDASAWTIPRPWHVTESFTLANGSWGTDAPIYIDNGTLRLVNVTITFSFNSYGTSMLLVGQNGSLNVTDSVLWCTREQGTIEVHNDTTMYNTTFRGEYWGVSPRAPVISHLAGRLVMDHCIHRQYGIVYMFLRSQADLVMRDCSVTDVLYAIQWEPLDVVVPGTGGRPILTIENTSIMAKGNYEGNLALEIRRSIQSAGGIALTSEQGMSAIIARCTIQGFHKALTVGNATSPCDYPVTVERNNISRCSWGAYVVSSAYSTGLRDNVWRLTEDTGDGDESTALWVNLVGSGAVTVQGDVTEGTDRGLTVTVGGLSGTARMSALTVVGARCAVYARAATLYLTNCTVHGVDCDFFLGNDACAYLYACDAGRRADIHGNGYVAAFGLVDIVGVEWQEGTPLTSGLVEFRSDGPTGHTLDASAPSPTWLPRWYVSSYYTGDIRSVEPLYRPEGYWFSGLPIDPWTEEEVMVVLIDDVPPVVNVKVPGQGSLLQGRAVTFEGECADAGAGVGSVNLSVDQGPWAGVFIGAGGQWCATFLVVPDGPHTLGIEAADRAGNAFRPDDLVFTTDATPPFIDVLSPGEVVGASPVLLSVQTERRSTARVNGTPVQVSVEGRFELWTTLRAGPNAFFIEVVDEAGNVNRTMYFVLLDVEPPSLVVQSPRDGDWMASSVIRVAGRAEEGARVWVNGYLAARDGAWFSHDLTVTDWEFHIWVEAEDAAGNRARVELDVNVDTVPPELRVLSPADGSLINANRTVITGFVFDNSSVRLAVGGVELGEVLGSWSCLVALAEGTNEVLVTAVDAAGNQAQRAIALVVDTVAPSASAELSLDGLKLRPSGPAALTRSGNATLVLDMGERCTVSATGLGTFQAGPGRAWYPVPLQEGPNEVIVEVTDEALNAGLCERFLIERDTTPPLLRIDTPPAPWDVHQPFIRLWGLVERGCTLTVNGTRVQVGEGGEYDTNITLVTGMNELRIVARDAAGNEESVTLRVPYSGPGPEPAGDGASPGAQVLLPLALLIVLLALLWGRVRRIPAPGDPGTEGEAKERGGAGPTVRRRPR